MKHPRDFSINEILASNWDKRLADDIAAELELASGEPRTSIPEIRRFFAIKSCRNLLVGPKAHGTANRRFLHSGQQPEEVRSRRQSLKQIHSRKSTESTARLLNSIVLE